MKPEMKRFLTIKDAASLLVCSEDTVRNMVRSGRLPAIRLGQAIRIPEDKVEISLAFTNRTRPLNKGKVE